MNTQPALEYKRGPCPQCGARTAKQAEDRCRATQGMDGDYHCAGSEREDARGWFLYPTAASLAALDRWYGEQAGLDQANITSARE